MYANVTVVTPGVGTEGGGNGRNGVGGGGGGRNGGFPFISGRAPPPPPPPHFWHVYLYNYWHASFGKGSSCVLTRLIVDNGWSSELKIFSEVAL